MYTFLAAFWVALGVSGASFAAASVLATGGVYGGPEQRRVYCNIFNGGSELLYLEEPDLLSQDGARLSNNVVNTCIARGPPPWPLPPDGTCVAGADIAQSATYACRVVIRGPKGKVRGTMDIRDESDQLLTSSPLR